MVIDIILHQVFSTCEYQLVLVIYPTFIFIEHDLASALQNFHVNMRGECASPGTMWASVMTSGSQGMPILHMYVGMVTFPFGRIILSMGMVVCSPLQIN